MKMNEELKAVLDQSECSTDVFYGHSIVVAIMKSGIERLHTSKSFVPRIQRVNYALRTLQSYRRDWWPCQFRALQSLLFQPRRDYAFFSLQVIGYFNILVMPLAFHKPCNRVCLCFSNLNNQVPIRF